TAMSDAKAAPQVKDGGVAERAPPAAPSPARSGSGLGPAGIIRACPIPSGAVIFGELTSAFVDGPRLVSFLGERRHTGAIVDAGRNRVQVALLYEGAAVGLVAVGEGATRRVEALSLPAPGSGDEHQLTVLTYRPEVTLALAQLVNTPERFDRMHGSFVDLPALLSFLRRVLGALLGTAMSLALLASCGADTPAGGPGSHDSPEGAVRGFLDAVAGNDVKDALNWIPPKQRKAASDLLNGALGVKVSFTV